MCNNPAPNQFHPHDDDTVIQPTGGLHLAIFDGYGMFNDCLDEDEMRIFRSIRLCHDCSVNFIDMFPLNFQHLFRGGHPNDMCGDNYKEMGCNYSWNVKDHIPNETV
jgi:hypothetical protein